MRVTHDFASFWWLYAIFGSMTKFRPCIDLHDGKVKQIVGGTLGRNDVVLETNFVSEQSSAYFAGLYRQHGLTGGHVIKLGPDNEEAALEALSAYPGGLQIGGGITADNASEYLLAGASHVIVTSYLFNDGYFQAGRLDELVRAVGAERLVLDLSCRRTDDGWVVAMDRWQTRTDLFVTTAVLDELAASCAEFLIHSADVEGKCGGIDEELVKKLGSWGKKPLTYAGGVKSLDDLALVDRLSSGQMDVTVGSALDIFGGNGVSFTECVAFGQRQQGDTAG